MPGPGSGLGSSRSDSSSEGPIFTLHLFHKYRTACHGFAGVWNENFLSSPASKSHTYIPTYIYCCTICTILYCPVLDSLFPLSYHAPAPQHSKPNDHPSNNAPATTFHSLGISSCCATASPNTVSLATLVLIFDTSVDSFIPSTHAYEKS